MKRLVEFPISDSDSVIVQVETTETQGMAPASRGKGDEVMKASRKFEDAIEQVRPAAEIVLKKLSSLSERPTEIEVEFGINLSMEAGAVIASASVEANYKVKLIWKAQSE